MFFLKGISCSKVVGMRRAIKTHQRGKPAGKMQFPPISGKRINA